MLKKLQTTFSVLKPDFEEFNLTYLGWGFLLAWVFLTFYLKTYALELPLQKASEPLYFNIIKYLPVFSAIATLLLSLKFEKQLAKVLLNPKIMYVSSIAVAIFTPPMLIPDFYNNWFFSIQIFSAVITGIGSAFLWLAWGALYSRLSDHMIEAQTLWSCVLGLILCFIISALNFTLLIFVFSLFPIMSAYCYIQKSATLHNTFIASAEKINTKEVLKIFNTAGIAIFISCIFICCIGIFANTFTDISKNYALIFFVGIIFTLLIGYLAIESPRKASLAFFFRVMTPIITFGLIAHLLFSAELAQFIGDSVSISARAGFCLITQIYFARYVANTKYSPIKIFGVAWIFVHLGDGVGILLSNICNYLLLKQMLSIVQIITLMILILISFIMFVLTDDYLLQGVSNYDADITNENTASDLEEIFNIKIQEVADKYELTQRQTEIFSMLAQGRSVPFIRDSLKISKYTVSTHTRNIYSKLGVHSKQELIDLVQER